MDGDGVANAIELYFGGDETNSGDAAVSQANILALSETAQQDADYDGVPDEYETAVGGDATSSDLWRGTQHLNPHRQKCSCDGRHRFVCNVFIADRLGIFKA